MSQLARPPYEFGPFRLEPDESRLLRDGTPVRVTPKALDLLTALVKRAGRVVTKEQLLAELWPGTFVEEGNLAVNMTALRHALDDGTGQSYIETVAKRGYRFAGILREPELQPQPEAVEAATAPSRARLWRWTLLAFAVSGVVALLVMQRRPSTSDATIRSLVVVPFASIGGAADQRHLELGMADAIITRLGALQQLSVPPTAAIRAGEDAFAAAARLKVDAVLTGSIQRDGDRIRVIAHLSSAGDGRQVWAARFDAPFTDIFDVQDSLAETIATNVLREVDGRDRAALRRRETAHVGAYELYLKGRERWLQMTPDSIRTAIQLYQDAIRLDPRFAVAFAGMASAYTSASSGLAPKERYPLAKAAVERALALDPQLPEAHTARSILAYKADWDWELADHHMQRALELEPNNAVAHRMYGQLLTLRGRFDAAIPEFRRALALDPYSIPIRSDLAALLIHGGQLAEARSILERGLEQDPNGWLMYRTLADVLAAEGREDESIEADLQAKQLVGDPPEDIAAQRDAYRLGGRAGFLRRQNELLLSRLGTATTGNAMGLSMYGAASSLAVNFARLRDDDQAIHWLQVAAERGEEGPLYLNLWHYDFIRDDPRFRALYRRVFGVKH